MCQEDPLNRGGASRLRSPFTHHSPPEILEPRHDLVGPQNQGAVIRDTDQVSRWKAIERFRLYLQSKDMLGHERVQRATACFVDVHGSAPKSCNRDATAVARGADRSSHHGCCEDAARKPGSSRAPCWLSATAEMLGGRLELPRPCGHWLLRPARLPFRHPSRGAYAGVELTHDPASRSVTSGTRDPPIARATWPGGAAR